MTLEGIEGVGKTTQLTLLAEALRNRHLPLLVTREPGGTPIGNEIRQVLLTPRADTMNPKTELLLMFAARAQHLSQIVWPALTQGQHVLCDRFTDASYAYQGGGRGIPSSEIGLLESLVQGDFRPDCVFILDADPKLALSRAKSRGGLDRIELEELTFFERVRAAYLARAKQDPPRYRIIDASASPDMVHQSIWSQLCPFLPQTLS